MQARGGLVFMDFERDVHEAAPAHDARDALLAHDHDAFAQAVTAGYDVRARTFDVDPRHTAMIDAARALGLPATCTGSGGAIV